MKASDLQAASDLARRLAALQSKLGQVAAATSVSALAALVDGLLSEQQLTAARQQVADFIQSQIDATQAQIAALGVDLGT